MLLTFRDLRAGDVVDVDLELGKLLGQVGHELEGERLPPSHDEEVVGDALPLQDAQSLLDVVPRQVVGRVRELVVAVVDLPDADERRHRVRAQLGDAALQLLVHVYLQPADDALMNNMRLTKKCNPSWQSSRSTSP